MAMWNPDHKGGASWSLEDIPYDALEHDRVRNDLRLFYIVASASFIEITSDLYTRNLIDYFRHDGEIVEWLETVWEKEEVQHGEALKHYVRTAWPEFDWEAAYRSFVADYGSLCTVEQLESTPALEMAARCVVETGTATFYRMLSEQSPEPVLKELAARISSDEVRHYKHFYRYFLRHQAHERQSRAAVLRTLWRRAAEVEGEDAFHAFRALYLARHPGTEFQKRAYTAYMDGIVRLARHHFPYAMFVKMMLKPLGLNAVVGRTLSPAIASMIRFLLSLRAARQSSPA